MSTKDTASIKVGRQKYKNVSDPLHSWGTLRRDINTLPEAKLRNLLKREMGSDVPRAIILRALTGRLNALARGSDGSRGPREYHKTLRKKIGLPSRSKKVG